MQNDGHAHKAQLTPLKTESSIKIGMISYRAETTMATLMMEEGRTFTDARAVF